MSAPLPPDEAERLQTLARYDVLDTPPDAALDRLTALAARLFHVPVALVSLVDEDRQYFKSRHGLDVCETPRDQSFCAHAILPENGGLLVVADATRDPRFADNPLVTGPSGVRFYAGAPLRMGNGHALGSLCLIDRQPREFSGEDRANLLDLAATAVDTLELHASRRLARKEAAERRWVEEALRRSEGRLRRMAANTPGMIYQFVLNPDGSFHFPFVGDGCREFFGAGPQAVYDRPELVLDALLTDADRAAFLASVVESARTLQPWNVCMAYRAPDGTARWLEGSSKPETLAGDKVLWNGMLVDITDRVRAQQQLKDSHRLLSAIIDGTDNTIFIKDRAGRYLLINPAGAAMLGRKLEDITGKDDFALFPPESARHIREIDEEIMRTGESRTYESSDEIAGVEHVFLSTKSPYRDADGNLLGVIGITREITEQRRAAEALREAKEEAEKANRAKSEFLSRMSHELRTPLNAILGFGQLLELSDLGDKNGEGVAHILKAGRHLLGLIDEVLAISRIEAGRMKLSLEPVAVAEVAQECMSLVSRLAADRRVACEDRCTPEGGPGRGVHVLADRQRLRQVLLNLLSNAVKYNREGGRVTLACRETEDADGVRRLRLEVSDTGTGLTADQIGRLFTPFERLGAERGPTEGTGLGLALSKGLMEAMNGRIGVNSVPGVGSTFWLDLPLARQAHAEADGAGLSLPGWLAAGEACEGTVLYVEDNMSNLRLIEMLLDGRPGVELLSAQQGLLGLEIARARRPDLVLLDLHLPDLPGWEVLTMLQADALTRDIPVVIISADATPGRIERLHAAGARDYLTKPIDVRELLRVLREYLKPCFAAEGLLVPSGRG